MKATFHDARPVDSLAHQSFGHQLLNFLIASEFVKEWVHGNNSFAMHKPENPRAGGANRHLHR
jgi:hypothetical protein